MFNLKIEKVVEKWTNNRSLDNKWQSDLWISKISEPNEIYGLPKKSSWCNWLSSHGDYKWWNTATKNLSIIVELVLFDLDNDKPSHITDTTGHAINVSN